MKGKLSFFTYAFMLTGILILFFSYTLYANKQSNGAVITMIPGLLFLLIGLVPRIVQYFKVRKESYLRKHGKPIQTKLEGVQINHSLSINGQNPYQIVTQWLNPETAELHLFTSNNIWYDPYDFIEDDIITVLIDKQNPDKYHVDLSFLPKLAN